MFPLRCVLNEHSANFSLIVGESTAFDFGESLYGYNAFSIVCVISAVSQSTHTHTPAPSPPSNRTNSGGYYGSHRRFWPEKGGRMGEGERSQGRGTSAANNSDTVVRSARPTFSAT